MLLRISLILAILLGIGTIVVSQKMARDHFTEMRNARNDFEDKMKKQTSRANTAEKSLASTSNKLNQTQATLTKTEEELNGKKQELAAAQERLNKTMADLKKANDDRTAALAQLEKWSQIGVSPEQVRDLLASVQKLKDAIVTHEVEKKVLVQQFTELENKFNLMFGPEDYVVRLPAGTKGNVVAVDPKWNFVVLDVGRDKNMLEGGVLTVHRNSKLVGKVRIREVLEHRSVASPVPGWKLGDVEEGDQVFY